MWGKKLAQDNDVKHHYFIQNNSACGKQNLSPDDYIQYNPNVAQESKCQQCLREICPQIAN